MVASNKVCSSNAASPQGITMVRLLLAPEPKGLFALTINVSVSTLPAQPGSISGPDHPCLVRDSRHCADAAYRETPVACCNEAACFIGRNITVTLAPQNVSMFVCSCKQYI